MKRRNENGKKAYIKKNENGIFWLYENNNGVWEQVDGDRRLFVVKEMAKNWNYKIIKEPK
jgi:hypothetical protein